MKHPLFAFLGVVIMLTTSCTKKEEIDPRLLEMQKRGQEMLTRAEALETEIKNTLSDEGKQNLLRHELELNKSRILRLKEQAKQLNGGNEFPIEPAPKAAEGSGH